MKRFLWILPFIAFLAGYYLISRFAAIHEFACPRLIGLPIQQAVSTLSDHHLNARIMAEKEDQDLTPGTVLSQNPPPNQRVKPHQSIFLVLSKKTHLATPLVVGKLWKDIQPELTHQNIRVKTYELESKTPPGTCIGQSPSAGTPLEDKKMIIYLSSSSTQNLILPTLTGHPVLSVIEALTAHQIPYTIHHTHITQTPHTCDSCIVIDQKPLAGSSINPNKPPHITLLVNQKTN